MTLGLVDESPDTFQNLLISYKFKEGKVDQVGAQLSNLEQRRRPVVVDAHGELGLAPLGESRLHLDDRPEETVALQDDGGASHEALHLQAHQVVHCQKAIVPRFHQMLNFQSSKSVMKTFMSVTLLTA